MPVRSQSVSTFGLYAHVPFCARRCAYCDFIMIPYTATRAARFLEALGKEAEILAAHSCIRGRRPRTLYFGGGTPSLLSPQELDHLFACIHQAFDTSYLQETTMESNPEALSPERLMAMRTNGVTRLSIGLQAWDDGLLKAIGRTHSVAEFLEAWRQARQHGFGNINVDLIFGLPGQSLAQWKETLQHIISLGPEHVSAYSIQVEEGTALDRWVRNGRVKVADEDLSARMYEMAIEKLVAAGYEHYEISNFARPGYRSLHNTLYWRNEDYIGLGPGAHSHCGHRRWHNSTRFDRYITHLAAGRLPIEEEDVLDEYREMSDTVILGLRLIDGLSGRDFQERFGCTLDKAFGKAIAEMMEQGLLERLPDNGLRLTHKGLLLANRVFTAFL